MPAVSGLEKEFPANVQSQNLDATTAKAREDIKKLGFHNHGLVIRSPEGKVLWKQPDHQVKMEDVRKAIRKLLEG